MMHVAIPTCATLTDSSNSSSYDVFKIHINGAYHCTMRYSQLLRLHEAIKVQYGDIDLPEFPPKKLKFTMGTKQKIERREALQQYLRAVCQHVITMNSFVVNEFFLEAQKDSMAGECQNLSNQVPIYMLDGTKNLIACNSGDSSSLILRRYAENVGLQSQNVPYFGLFLVRKSSTCPYEIIRWLKDFECPLLSLHTQQANASNAKSTYKIVVRKCFWDLNIQKRLVNDPVAMHILYAQAVAELLNWTPSTLKGMKHPTTHWSPLNGELVNQLQSLQQNNAMHEFLIQCQTHPRYGIIYFETSSSDYIIPNQTVGVAAGNRQLILLHKTQTGEITETSFRVTRIRCWKLSNNDTDEHPYLSFEYLVSRNRLEWITIFSKQSILISVFLQSMVDEIVRCHDGVTNGYSSASTESPSSVDSGNASFNGSTKSRSSFSYESFGEIGSSKKNAHSLTNEAFNTITDEDL